MKPLKILVGKTFGIGNSILTVPLIKALSTIGEVDVLIGSTNDDIGAISIFQMFKRWNSSYLKNVFIDRCPLDREYDVAVMAIPFDGRWQNGLHFKAKTVMDGRKRPGNVERLGLDMWQKHEVEYQMENAADLGIETEVPSLQFFERGKIDASLIYVGIGFKRDPGGFGLSKHFGTQRFIELMKYLRSKRPEMKFVSSGSIHDFTDVGSVIQKAIGDFYSFQFVDLFRSMEIIGSCRAYIGNDTGMMHAAASCKMPTYALMALEGSQIKNPPLCDNSVCRMFSEHTQVEDVGDDFLRLIDGS